MESFSDLPPFLKCSRCKCTFLRRELEAHRAKQLKDGSFVCQDCTKLPEQISLATNYRKPTRQSSRSGFWYDNTLAIALTFYLASLFPLVPFYWSSQFATVFGMLGANMTGLNAVSVALGIVVFGLSVASICFAIRGFGKTNNAIPVFLIFLNCWALCHAFLMLSVGFAGQLLFPELIRSFQETLLKALP